MDASRAAGVYDVSIAQEHNHATIFNRICYFPCDHVRPVLLDAIAYQRVAAHWLSRLRKRAWSWVKQDEQLRKKIVPKPPKPEEPPPQMEQPMDCLLDAEGTMDLCEVGDDTREGGLALESGDGEYLPTLRLRQFIQGVLFNGVLKARYCWIYSNCRAVRDPIVVEATRRHIEQAAIDAAMKFKYKPRVVNGEATEVSGVQNRISFQIDG